MKTTLKHIQAFIRFQYKKDDIYIDELDHSFAEGFHLYLMTEHKCNQNTANKYLKNFKKIVRIALDRELLAKDPFIRIKYNYTPVNREYLSKEQIDKIMNKEFEVERLRIIRDVFIFYCYTGLSFVDAKNLKEQHLTKDNNGVKVIRIARQKTAKESFIPLRKTLFKL